MTRAKTREDDAEPEDDDALDPELPRRVRVGEAKSKASDAGERPSEPARPTIRDRAREGAREMGRFLAAASGTVALDAVLGLGLASVWAAWIAKVTAFVASSIVAFALYRFWVFRARGALKQQLSRFAILYVVAGAASVITSQILLATKTGGEGDLGHALAWAAGALVTIVTSYLGMKLFVFRRSSS